MRTWFWIAALCAAPLAQAGDKLIFACTDARGKQVRVTEQGGQYRYQFGQPKRAELVFENNRQEAIARSPRWNGIGRDLWTNLVLQNGDYRYALFASVDRLSPRHGTAYGVTIHRLLDGEERYVAQVLCDKKHKIVADFPEEVMF